MPALARKHETAPLALKPPRIVFPAAEDAAALAVAKRCTLLGFQVVESRIDLAALFEGRIRPEMIVCLYSAHGTNSLRFTGEHEQPKGSSFVWHWAVALNPKLHVKKLFIQDEIAKSIAHTFGEENFHDRIRTGQYLWGGSVAVSPADFEADPLNHVRSRVVEAPHPGK